MYSFNKLICCTNLLSCSFAYWLLIWINRNDIWDVVLSIITCLFYILTEANFQQTQKFQAHSYDHCNQSIKRHQKNIRPKDQIFSAIYYWSMIAKSKLLVSLKRSKHGLWILFIRISLWVLRFFPYSYLIQIGNCLISTPVSIQTTGTSDFKFLGKIRQKLSYCFNGNLHFEQIFNVECTQIFVWK